jgi:hypothetical protein
MRIARTFGVAAALAVLSGIATADHAARADQSSSAATAVTPAAMAALNLTQRNLLSVESAADVRGQGRAIDTRHPNMAACLYQVLYHHGGQQQYPDRTQAGGRTCNSVSWPPNWSPNWSPNWNPNWNPNSSSTRVR